MNYKKVAFTLIKRIKSSSDKELTIRKIAVELNGLPSDDRHLILTYIKYYINQLDLKKSILYESFEIRAQSNESYIEYLELLSSLTKDE